MSSTDRDFEMSQSHGFVIENIRSLLFLPWVAMWHLDGRSLHQGSYPMEGFLGVPAFEGSCLDHGSQLIHRFQSAGSIILIQRK